MVIIDSQVHAYEANTPSHPRHTVPNWPITLPVTRCGGDGQGRARRRNLDLCLSMYRYDAELCGGVPTAAIRSVPRSLSQSTPTIQAVGRFIATGHRARRHPHQMTNGGEARADITRASTRSCARPVTHGGLSSEILCWARGCGQGVIGSHPILVIIDHLAILQPPHPPAPPQRGADLPKVVEACPAQKNRVIKVSGACTLCP